MTASIPGRASAEGDQADAQLDVQADSVAGGTTNGPDGRERAANLDGQTVFAIDYQICRRCQLGWSNSPAPTPHTNGAV